MVGEFQEVSGEVAGLTINNDGSFSFNTELYTQDEDYDNLADGDTRQINVVYEFTSGGDTKTEDLIISLTGTATTPTAEILSGAHVGVAGRALNIQGTYEYVSTAGGGTVSNEFVISIAGTTDTQRTATFMSAVSNQQELSLTELRSLQFLAAENASGLADFSFEVTDDGAAASNGAGNENTLTQTLALDILNFNDIPELPEVQIVFDGTQTKQSGQEDTDYTFTAADLLAGVVDPDILYDQDGNVITDPTATFWLSIVCQ